jgi:hypothetical protein
LRNLSQAFTLIGVDITPCSAALQFVQDFGPRLDTALGGELIPQVFHQLQAFEPSKMLDGLK